jgi:hypothetical protein
MKKTSTIGTVLVLCIGFQPANAGLLGMPLNLKAVMAQAELDGFRVGGSSPIPILPVLYR